MNVPVIPPVGLVLSEQQVLAGDPPGGEGEFTAILQAILAGSGEKVTLPGSPACNGLLPIIGSVGTALPEGAGETAAAAGDSAGEKGYPARDRAGARADNSLELLALAGQMIQVAGCQAAVPGEADAPSLDRRGDVQGLQPAVVNPPMGLTRLPSTGEPPRLQPVDEKLPAGLRRVLSPGELPAANDGPVRLTLNGTDVNQQPVEVMLSPGMALGEPPGELPAADSIPDRLRPTGRMSGLTVDEPDAVAAAPVPDIVPQQPAAVGLVRVISPPEPPAVDGVPVGLDPETVKLPPGLRRVETLGEPPAAVGMPEGLRPIKETPPNPSEGTSMVKPVTLQGKAMAGEPVTGGANATTKEITRGTSPSGLRQDHPVEPVSSGRETGELAHPGPVPGVEPSPPPAELPVTAVTNPAVERSTEEPSLQVPAGDPSERDIAVHLVRQVADRARWLKGAEEIKLQFRLKPDHLGQVHVCLSFSEGGRLHAHFRVENLPAQVALKTGFQELREALQEQGIRLDGFNVDLGWEGFHDFQPQGRPAAFAGGARTRWVARYEEAEETTSTVSSASIRGLMGMGSHVDYLV